MCGINGFFNFAGMEIPGGAALLERMNLAVAHRGPDDSGVWTDQSRKVCLGHRRLSILDLSERGHQPMISPRRSVVVFNGEIYNFKQLKDSFQDHDFLSETDTEVLLALYDRHGEDCLRFLNGMFAFAIWDENRGQMFLARDRLGKKPLYYTTLGGVFAFSSEIKALLTLPWIRPSLDEEALYHFLTYNSLVPPRTMFQGIHKLPPGYSMTVTEKGTVSCKPYWETAYTNLDGHSEEDLCGGLIDELRRAVGMRMVSDVPVGAFLSGGVDSSAIVALMSESGNSRLSTYSIGFEGAADYDEREHAQSIARRFSTDHHEKIVKRNDLLEFLPRIAEIYDEPLADATSIPIYFISEMARANKTLVVLTGDGADELFCGYVKWLKYVRLQPWYKLYSQVPRPIKSAVKWAYGKMDDSSFAFEMLARAANNQEFFWGGAGGFKEATKRAFLSDEYARRMSRVDSYDVIREYRDRFSRLPGNGRRMSYVDWMAYVGVKNMIPNLYLYRADRLGMANSIELRAPFLDHRLVNFALSIPGSFKTKNNEPKYILKKSLEPLLPKETLYRKKMGFCVPLSEWTGDVIVDYLETNLKTFCRDTGLFNEAALREQIRHTRQGGRDYIFTLWNIYFLISWFRKWML
jgi:asparagine synthase (glutamine-hydrolysing)